MYLCLFNIYANPENPGINDLQSRDFWDQILVRDPEFRDPGIVFPSHDQLPQHLQLLHHLLHVPRREVQVGCHRSVGTNTRFIVFIVKNAQAFSRQAAG
jgi:hypothetical protein